MLIVASLLTQIIPMFGLIALGWVLGRTLKLDLKTLANLSIYALAPIVTFGAVLQIHFNPVYMLLPLITLAAGGLVSTLVYRAGKRFRPHNPDINLLALIGSTVNSGYFGLPVVIALFPPEWVGVYLMANMGIGLSEAIFGYYFLARGHFSVKESIRRVLRLPMLYAVIIGTACSASGLMLPETLLPVWVNFKGAFIIIGMALIGVALSQQRNLHIDLKFILATFTVRHLLWAVFILGFILTDAALFHIFPPQVHGFLALFPLLPLAANITAYAVDLKADVGKAASTVLLSQLFGAILIILCAVLGYFDWAQKL